MSSYFSSASKMNVGLISSRSFDSTRAFEDVAASLDSRESARFAALQASSAGLQQELIQRAHVENTHRQRDTSHLTNEYSKIHGANVSGGWGRQTESYRRPDRTHPIDKLQSDILEIIAADVDDAYRRKILAHRELW